MDEKQTIKELRMIETEMAYLEKMIERQKKVLKSFSYGYFLRWAGIVAAGVLIPIAASSTGEGQMTLTFLHRAA